METKPSPLKLILAFLAVYILWGSTYLAIRISIETLPPFWMAAIRFLSAGAILYFFATRRGKIKPSAAHWKSAFIVGGLMLLGGNGAVVWAEQLVPSGITALIVATVPLWMVLIDAVRQKRSPDFRIIAGLLLGFSGIGFLVKPDTGGAAVNPLGVCVLLFAAFSWAVGSIYSRHAKLPSSSFVATAIEMLAGGTLLLLAGFLSGEWRAFSLAALSLRSVIALAYLIFLGALVGFTAYMYCVKHTPPALSSTYAYVNPLIAVFLGWAVAGEPLSPRIMTGAAIIVTGVFLITISQPKRA